MSCGICGGDLDLEPIVFCEDCQTPHHQECWEYSEQCSIYGCGCSVAIDVNGKVIYEKNVFGILDAFKALIRWDLGALVRSRCGFIGQWWTFVILSTIGAVLAFIITIPHEMAIVLTRFSIFTRFIVAMPAYAFLSALQAMGLSMLIPLVSKRNSLRFTVGLIAFMVAIRQVCDCSKLLFVAWHGFIVPFVGVLLAAKIANEVVSKPNYLKTITVSVFIVLFN